MKKQQHFKHFIFIEFNGYIISSKNMFLNDNPGRNIYIFIYILMQWFYEGIIDHTS